MIPLGEELRFLREAVVLGLVLAVKFGRLQEADFLLGRHPSFGIDMHINLFSNTSGNRHSLILFPAALVAAVLVSVSLPSCNLLHKKPVEEPVDVKDTVYPLGFCTDSFDLVDGIVKSGETFTGLMMRLGLSQEEAYALAEECDTLFDVRRMRAGNSYQAYYDADTTEFRHLAYVVYENNRIRRTVFKTTDPMNVSVYDKDVVTEERFADVTINSSLWNDMRAADVSPLLIMKLSEIYAWTVDFFALQKGDRFRVLYDENICEGETIGIDSVRFSLFDHSGKEFVAVMLSQRDSGNLYWNENGESLQKAFLKAPLKFTRISSGFSYARRHPVYGSVRPHTAVDYAAPTGTPVMAIGDGTIISAGWAGGGGNTIKIKHNSVYTTSYMHMSRFAPGMKAGRHVSQGEVIGYVGMTGTATGPHLDFRVWKNDEPIDPLSLESPNADPIKDEFRPALDSVYAVYRAKVDSLSALAAELPEDLPENSEEEQSED